MERELSKNKKAFLALLGESADIKKKTMLLGIRILDAFLHMWKLRAEVFCLKVL